MNQPLNHLRFLSLADRLGGGNAELAAALGIDRTMAWRLRSGKVTKLQKYITILEKCVDRAEGDPLDRVFDDLITWSRQSPDVRAVVTSLHSMLQNNATS